MNKSEKGITLIALILTIIILLILAVVSINSITKENGILSKASETQLRCENADVTEKLSLISSEYELDKGFYGNFKTLIEYLQSKQIIGSELSDNSEKYQINTEKLLGKKTKFGNGIANETSKNDVYTIEKTNSEDDKTTYEIIYYDENQSSTIGQLHDLKEKKNLITFKIDDTQYNAEEGMTWKEFIKSEKYNSLGMIENEGNISNNIYIDIVLWDENYTRFISVDEKIIDGYNYKMRSIAECVYPDSNILVSADGKTILAKDIKTNDYIMYFDFSENIIKTGKVKKTYIHKNANSFVKYIFNDNSFIKATDYHPIYTKQGWKSLTNRHNYEKPQNGDLVKTPSGWKVLKEIKTFIGNQNCYDFEVIGENGEKINNYFANGTLVQGSY